jgi:hypothetical protein
MVCTGCTYVFTIKKILYLLVWPVDLVDPAWWTYLQSSEFLEGVLAPGLYTCPSGVLGYLHV